MADLKTTAERRDRFRSWLHDDTRDRLSIRAWCVAEDACDDVDTLITENAKLRAVAEALKAERRILQGPPLPPNTRRSATMQYFDAQQETDAALAALGAP